MKFVNIGLSGSIKTKDPSSDGTMPDMSTGTDDISKLIEGGNVTFEVTTSEYSTITPEDMQLPWIVTNQGSVEAVINFSTYDYDPSLLSIALGGTVTDEDAGGAETDNVYEAPTTGFAVQYKAIKVVGETVDGYQMELRIRKAAIRADVHSKFGVDAGTVEWYGMVVTPEDTSSNLQTPWSLATV